MLDGILQVLAGGAQSLSVAAVDRSAGSVAMEGIQPSETRGGTSVGGVGLRSRPCDLHPGLLDATDEHRIPAGPITGPVPELRADSAGTQEILLESRSWRCWVRKFCGRAPRRTDGFDGRLCLAGIFSGGRNVIQLVTNGPAFAVVLTSDGGEPRARLGVRRTGFI